MDSITSKALYCALWRRGVLLCSGPWQKLPSVVKKYGYKLPIKKEPDALAACIHLGNGESVIWSKEPLDTPELAHELLHAASRLLADIGVEDEESLAYTLEHLLSLATTSCEHDAPSLSLQGDALPPQQTQNAHSAHHAKSQPFFSLSSSKSPPFLAKLHRKHTTQTALK